jgi:hypothetical protein
MEQTAIDKFRKNQTMIWFSHVGRDRHIDTII